VIEITPLVEQVRPESAALDGFQKLLGMMASVSTLARSKGATNPVNVSNFCIVANPMKLEPLKD